MRLTHGCLCMQVSRDVNNMTVKMPYQCFINGQFEDAENGKTYDTINPNDGSVSGSGAASGRRVHADRQGVGPHPRPPVPPTTR